MLRAMLVATFMLAGLAVQDSPAQRRRVGGQATADPSGTTEISISARVGPKSYTSKVSGTCKHASEASIYDVPAALWMVQSDPAEGSEIKHLSFTLWKPKDGSTDQVSLSLETGSGTTRIEVSPRATAGGAAKVDLREKGRGGEFELTGKSAEGTSVRLKMTCQSFAGVEAAGG